MDMQDENSKRKRFDIFLDFDKIDAMVDRMVKEMLDGKKIESNKPRVMGFSMKVSPNGRSRIERFGNVNAARSPFLVPRAREPLTDILEGENDFTVTAEMPGAEEMDILLDIKPELLAISSGEKSPSPFFKEIVFSEPVLPKSLVSSFKNGILEVRVKKSRARSRYLNTPAEK